MAVIMYIQCVFSSCTQNNALCIVNIKLLKCVLVHRMYMYVHTYIHCIQGNSFVS